MPGVCACGERHPGDTRAVVATLSLESLAGSVLGAVGIELSSPAVNALSKCIVTGHHLALRHLAGKETECLWLSPMCPEAAGEGRPQKVHRGRGPENACHAVPYCRFWGGRQLDPLGKGSPGGAAGGPCARKLHWRAVGAPCQLGNHTGWADLVVQGVAVFRHPINIVATLTRVKVETFILNVCDASVDKVGPHAPHRLQRNRNVEGQRAFHEMRTRP